MTFLDKPLHNTSPPPARAISWFGCNDSRDRRHQYRRCHPTAGAAAAACASATEAEDTMASDALQILTYPDIEMSP